MRGQGFIYKIVVRLTPTEAGFVCAPSGGSRTMPNRLSAWGSGLGFPPFLLLGPRILCVSAVKFRCFTPGIFGYAVSERQEPSGQEIWFSLYLLPSTFYLSA